MLVCRFCGKDTESHNFGHPNNPRQMDFWSNGYKFGRSGWVRTLTDEHASWKLGYEQGWLDRNRNDSSIPQLEVRFGPIYAVNHIVSHN
jgi:hypothetical protein